MCPTQAAANQADFQKYQANKQSAGRVARVKHRQRLVGGAAKALAHFDPKLPVK